MAKAKNRLPEGKTSHEDVSPAELVEWRKAMRDHQLRAARETLRRLGSELRMYNKCLDSNKGALYSCTFGTVV
jgi:hypothetical protein